jgi:hypothetical protein
LLSAAAAAVVEHQLAKLAALAAVRAVEPLWQSVRLAQPYKEIPVELSPRSFPLALAVVELTRAAASDHRRPLEQVAKARARRLQEVLLLTHLVDQAELEMQTFPTVLLRPSREAVVADLVEASYKPTGSGVEAKPVLLALSSSVSQTRTL